MASATIPRPPSVSPRASTHAHTPDHDRVAILTPTRQFAGPPPSAHSVRITLNSSEIMNRDAGHDSASRPSSWPLDPLHKAGGFRDPAERSRSRDDAADSTVLSKTNSGSWSDDDSDITSSEAYYSPPTAPLRRFPVPPPQPLPPRGMPVFRPPPPWHPPVGTISGPPRIQSPRGPSSTASEPESEVSSAGTRSLSPDGRPPQELQGEVESKREKIWELRHVMAGKRKELRELRRLKDNMDNAFMQIFRHLTSKGRVAMVPVDLVKGRFREMQNLRDEYYASESAYEAMELELEREETILEMLEIDLSQNYRGRADLRGRFAIPAQPVKSDGSVDNKMKEDPHHVDAPAPPPPFLLLGISGDLPEDIHPLYQELLEAAGNRKLAEEYCEDLEMHYEKILYDLEIELHRKRVRDNQGNQISEADLKSLRSSLTTVPTDAAEFEARFGIPINEDDLEFLRDHDLVSKQARKELDSASQTLAQLRTLCLKKNVMRKHASYHEQLAIFSGSPLWSPPPADGNMAIDPPPPPPLSGRGQSLSLAHPRFPILLSNPSHTLHLLSPLQALEHALKLPKDDPSSALRRAECMKELGISMLTKTVEGVGDYVNQWLIHRLRTCPMEAELMLAVAEGVFRVVNLGRWQEEVLYFWRLDGAGREGGGEDGSGGASPPPEVGGGEEEWEELEERGDGDDDWGSEEERVNSVVLDGEGKSSGKDAGGEDAGVEGAGVEDAAGSEVAADGVDGSVGSVDVEGSGMAEDEVAGSVGNENVESSGLAGDEVAKSAGSEEAEGSGMAGDEVARFVASEVAEGSETAGDGVARLVVSEVAEGTGIGGVGVGESMGDSG